MAPFWSHYYLRVNRNGLMQLYEYIADAIGTRKKIDDNAFSEFKVKKNKSGSNTLLIKPDGKKYMMIDLNKLRR